MEEIFKQIEGYPNYFISNHGRLRKTTRSGFKYFSGSPSSSYTHTQYSKMNLSINGKNKTVMAHRLVAEAFIPNPENKPMVNHKDFNGLNNHMDNLEWVTASENMQHSADKKDSKRIVKLEGDKAGRNARLYQTFMQYQEHIGKLFGDRICIGVNYKLTGANNDGSIMTKWTAITACTKCGAEAHILFVKLLSEPTKCNDCARLENVKKLQSIRVEDIV